MSDSKFTPGPWVVEKLGVGDPYLVHDGSQYKAAVAVTATGNFGCDKSIANARLIAAAPELLEACKAFADYMNGPTSWTQDQEDALIIRVHSVIAKATGA
ncbi:hypothetical protein KDX40_04740 [Burkholderia ambifaria]|uniref:hypothetical protein n=1 Tax=Burkholderia ambifaria TaxID=152480 RepID=UPI001B961CB1|nr:hypothetical protein [Burkholderia ambifaria]MBR8343044.1 hypothetical protein [Burkholderia ambifaria]